MRLRYLVFIFLLFLSIKGFATLDNPYFQFQQKSKVVFYKHGAINWTEGYFLGRAKDTFSSKLKNVPYERIRLENRLIQTAKKNLLNIILDTKVDSYNYVRDYFNKNKDFQILFLEEIEKNILILPPVNLGSGEIEAVVKYTIYGKSSLTDLIYRLNDYVQPTVVQEENHIQRPNSYSSLIIDLRRKFKLLDKVSEKIDPNSISPRLLRILLAERFPGNLRHKLSYDERKKLLTIKGVMLMKERNDLLGLSKDILYREAILELYKRSQTNEKELIYALSLFPSIYDSNGNNVYSKDMIELLDRSRIRYVKYTKDPLIFYNIEIVGNNPLYVIPDKIKGENNTDIIINKEVSEKIFVTHKTINNLKEGKIFLIVD